MMDRAYIDSALLLEMIRGGAENLGRHCDEVNDLNVFPIPDGDTGSNMLLTITGGGRITPYDEESVGDASRRAADGMLLSARGNSGVILSQFADGIADGLSGLETADPAQTAEAFCRGVERAYSSVMEPVEGTILTVVREATEYAASRKHADISGYLSDFLNQARKTLKNTPEMLPVLKKAGVVDSGGAGLIYIIEGMNAVLNGKEPSEAADTHTTAQPAELDLDMFGVDSVLEYGYCTELLLRLQSAKVDVDSFDENVIKQFLHTVGDSIVCFKNGSIVKLHVHTKTPYRVLEFCQRFGEYLTVKIENMSLQHNNLPKDSHGRTERGKYAVIAVASGEGIKQTFSDMGADRIVDGGQSMNPSADDFIEAIDAVNADTVFVLPNNPNVILAAKQAAKLYRGSDVRVIETKTIGDCYAVLTMLDLDPSDPDEIEAAMNESMRGVITAAVSRCSRDADMDGFSLHDGQYIGFIGKHICSADNDRRDTACMLVDSVDFEDRQICIIVRGKDSFADEAEEIASHVRKTHRGCEVYVIDGGQEIYSYILIIE